MDFHNRKLSSALMYGGFERPDLSVSTFGQGCPSPALEFIGLPLHWPREWLHALR
jgi:hypothetical protein